MDLKEILNADILFVESHNLTSYLETYYDDIRSKVIIAGNSDYEFHCELNFPKSVRLALLQNSYISDNERIRTLPIGIENFRWGVNGNPKYLTGRKKLDQRLSRVLFGPFGRTHPVRLEVEEEFTNTVGPWDVLEGYIKPKEYQTISNRYKYVGAVRGNGVDTHRLWETLYRGGLPIVLRDSWSDSLTSLSLPIIQTARWHSEDILGILNGNLDSHFDPKKIPALWMPYWTRLINESLCY